MKQTMHILIKSRVLLHFIRVTVCNIPCYAYLGKNGLTFFSVCVCFFLFFVFYYFVFFQVILFYGHERFDQHMLHANVCDGAETFKIRTDASNRTETFLIGNDT